LKRKEKGERVNQPEATQSSLIYSFMIREESIRATELFQKIYEFSKDL